MKTAVRLISASTIALGLAFAPALAKADTGPAADVLNPAEEKDMGARRVFEQAIADVQLRPEQQDEVDQLKAEAEKRHAPVKAAKSELMTALADQVERGDVDICAMEPQVEKVAQAKAKAAPEDRKAFEKLHQIMEPEQRTKFVDALKKRYQEYRRSKEPTALADKMARELQLNDDQKSRVTRILKDMRDIEDAMGAHQHHRDRWSRILEAFKGEHFVMDEVAPAEDVAEHATKRIERHLAKAKVIMPVLDKEQQHRLADKIREKARRYSQTGTGGTAH